MGQAKRRGTFEQRAANPNPKHHHRDLTPEERESLRQRFREIVAAAMRSLFGTSKQPKKARRRIRTGG